MLNKSTFISHYFLTLIIASYSLEDFYVYISLWNTIKRAISKSVCRNVI
jgi:hypothetical protein